MDVGRAHVVALGLINAGGGGAIGVGGTGPIKTIKEFIHPKTQSHKLFPLFKKKTNTPFTFIVLFIKVIFVISYIDL